MREQQHSKNEYVIRNDSVYFTLFPTVVRTAGGEKGTVFIRQIDTAMTLKIFNNINFISSFLPQQIKVMQCKVAGRNMRKKNNTNCASGNPLGAFQSILINDSIPVTVERILCEKKNSFENYNAKNANKQNNKPQTTR